MQTNQCRWIFFCSTVQFAEQNGVNCGLQEFFFPLSRSEVTLAGWAPGRDPSGRQTAGRGTRSCCPSQPTGRLTGPKACQTDTTPGRAGGREGAGEGAREGVYGGGGWHRGQSVSNAFIYLNSRIEGERTLREGTVNGLPLCPLLACDWGCFRWHREKRGETLQ